MEYNANVILIIHYIYFLLKDIKGATSILILLHSIKILFAVPPSPLPFGQWIHPHSAINLYSIHNVNDLSHFYYKI